MRTKTLACVLAPVVLLSACLVAAQNPTTLCNPTNTGSTFRQEGYFYNLRSSPPSGFRVNIHVFGWLPLDTATYSSDYFFMRGAANGFEGVSWPWVRHFSETNFLPAAVLHTYRPLPLVLGGNGATVGYAIEADHDGGGSGSDITLVAVTPPLTTSDSFFSIEEYGAVLTEPPLFTGQFQVIQRRTARTCFTYTLDQVGATSLARGGTRFLGFNKSSFELRPCDGSVYNLISHATLSLHGEFRNGTLAAAGLQLPDGHRFTVLPNRFEAVLANGELASVHLDEAWAANVQPLLLGLASDDDEVLPPLVFVASFADREAVLHDPLLARYHDLGDLAVLDEADTAVTARFTLTMASYEITLITVEATDNSGVVSSRLELLSHERAFLASEGDAAEFAAGQRPKNAAHGLLGVTSGAHLAFDDEPPAWQLPGTLEDYRVPGDDLFGTGHKHNLFRN